MKVITTVVGELGTNCYLLIDEATREAALIDPADSPDELSAPADIVGHPRRNSDMVGIALDLLYVAGGRLNLRGENVGRNFYHEVRGLHCAPILGFKQHSAI